MVYLDQRFIYRLLLWNSDILRPGNEIAPASREEMANRLIYEQEYKQLKKFVSFFAECFLYPNGNPSNRIVDSVRAELEIKAPAKVAAGLIMAVNDCVDMCPATGSLKRLMNLILGLKT